MDDVQPDGRTKAISQVQPTPAEALRWLLTEEEMHPFDAASALMDSRGRPGNDVILRGLLGDPEFDVDDLDMNAFSFAVVMVCTLDAFERIEGR